VCVETYLPAYEDGTDSVPKRQHIKSRRRGITQKKEYSIQNKAKVLNPEVCYYCTRDGTSKLYFFVCNIKWNKFVKHPVPPAVFTLSVLLYLLYIIS